MTSTDKLREKLDALGIEHLDNDLPNDKQTRWNKRAGGWGACYVEITRNSILPADSIIENRTLRIYDCTPEQAIAATLGGGKLTAEQVCETVEKHWHDLPDEYNMPEATALPEYSYDWQAIADELNSRVKPPCDGGYCPLCGARRVGE